MNRTVTRLGPLVEPTDFERELKIEVPAPRKALKTGNGKTKTLIIPVNRIPNQVLDDHRAANKTLTVSKPVPKRPLRKSKIIIPKKDTPDPIPPPAGFVISNKPKPPSSLPRTQTKASPSFRDSNTAPSTPPPVKVLTPARPRSMEVLRTPPTSPPRSPPRSPAVSPLRSPLRTPPRSPPRSPPDVPQRPLSPRGPQITRKPKIESQVPQRPLSPRPAPKRSPTVTSSRSLPVPTPDVRSRCENCGKGSDTTIYACGHRLCVGCAKVRNCPVCGESFLDVQAAYEDAFEQVLEIEDVEERYAKFVDILEQLGVPDFLEKGEYWGTALEEARLPTQREFDLLLHS